MSEQATTEIAVDPLHMLVLPDVVGRAAFSSFNKNERNWTGIEWESTRQNGASAVWENVSMNHDPLRMFNAPSAARRLNVSPAAFRGMAESKGLRHLGGHYFAADVERIADCVRDATIAPAVDVPAELLKPGIYFLVSGGEVVYVGQSTCPLARIGWHKIAYDAVKFVPVEPDLLDAAEQHFIRLHRPKFNQQCNGAVRWSR
jgi:hypothetical protein